MKRTNRIAIAAFALAAITWTATVSAQSAREHRGGPPTDQATAPSPMSGAPMMSHHMKQAMMQRMMEHMQHSGSDMMGPGMMGSSQNTAGFGRRVIPSLELTVEDVSRHFSDRLGSIDNDRLKLGPVKEVGKDTITVDFVTVDDFLVERFNVDRNNRLIARADAS